ncbi:MAG: glycosyl transferase family 2, partial [Roseibacillus sp.]
MESLKWIWYGAYILVLLGLSGYGCHRLCIVYLYLKHSWRRPKPKREFEELPLVTVQLPVFNELHVVERLLTSVSQLDYPKDKLQIQLLDDSTDETTEISRVEIAKLAA